jgi:hypothetical protein
MEYSSRFRCSSKGNRGADPALCRSTETRRKHSNRGPKRLLPNHHCEKGLDSNPVIQMDCGLHPRLCATPRTLFSRVRICLHYTSWLNRAKLTVPTISFWCSYHMETSPELSYLASLGSGLVKIGTPKHDVEPDFSQYLSEEEEDEEEDNQGSGDEGR